MTKLGPIELARKSLEMRIRAEANIIRLRYLNEVLPHYLGEFDRRLNNGEALELEAPTADEFIAEALKGTE